MELQTMVHYYLPDGYYFALFFTAVASVLIAAYADIRTALKESGMPVKLVSLATSAGICLYGMKNFRTQDAVFSTPENIEYIKVICALLALYFVYIAQLYLYFLILPAVELTILVSRVSDFKTVG